MPRTKMHRKKSSMKKKGQSLIRQTSASVESLASSQTSGGGEDQADLNVLLTTVYESPADFKKAFEAFYQRRVDAHVERYEYCVQYVKNMFSNIIKNYPENYLNSPTSSIYNMDVCQDENSDQNTKASSSHQSRLQASKAEFKKPKTPRKDRASRKRSLSVPTPAAPQPPSFKTPLNSARSQMALIKTITPKVSNTPVSVMRRPQHGEIAFSTSGSPLLIGAISREDIPTISVPMNDGRVFSILPDPGMPPPDLPNFDEDTKKYLRTLREHLAMLSSSP